jgi:hypothetical protein
MKLCKDCRHLNQSGYPDLADTLCHHPLVEELRLSIDPVTGADIVP